MGAKLEVYGQTRDTLPYYVSTSFEETLQFTSAVTLSSEVTPERELPFDSGPDRSARVFLVLSQIGILLSHTLAVAAGRYRARVWWYDVGGNKIHLVSIASDLLAEYSVTLATHILLPMPFFNSKPASLGTLAIETIAIPAATTIDVTVTGNLGFYTDYDTDVK